MGPVSGKFSSSAFYTFWYRFKGIINISYNLGI